MKFIQVHVYKNSLDTILQFYQNEEIATKKMIDLGSRHVEFASVINEHGLPTVTVHREVGVEPPDLLREFISKWNKSSQVDVWSKSASGAYICDMTFHSSAPVLVSASMELRQTAKGCTNKTTTKIEATMPVLAGVIERYVKDRIMEAVGEEYFYIAEQAKILEQA